MNCTRFRKIFGAYLDNEAPHALRAKLESHLISCDACRRTLASAQALSALLYAKPVPPVPDGFAQRVMNLAKAQQSNTPSSLIMYELVHWLLNLSRPMRAATAAVILLGLTLGALMGRDLGQIRSSPQPPNTSSADTMEIYNLDYLSEAPRDSLSHIVLTLDK